MVKEDITGTSAAIASIVAAEVQDLDILARSIEDNQDNTTRFFVIRKGVDPAGKDSIKQTKSLVTFTVDHHQPGALSSVLECFRKADINLTGLNSRPSRVKPFEYVFFVEFEGSRLNAHSTQVRAALDSMQGFVKSYRWLGSWDDKWQEKSRAT